MTHETIGSPFKSRGRVAHSPVLPLATSGMRRSKSAGDKFVFGARRRNLTPVSRQDISGDQPGITSPRPNRIKRQNNSNYSIVDLGKDEYAAGYNKKETEDLQKFLFSRDRTKTVEEDIARLMKLLFRK